MTGGGRIRLDGWGWRHAGRREPALSGVELHIEPGERVLLLGPSGAGKSTLLEALAGVLGGEEEGEESGRLTVDGRRPSEQRGIAGLVLQDPDAQVVMARVGDDVAFGCENLAVPRDEIWTRVAEALEAVGLRLPLDHPTSLLSGGQKQRLALAGSLAMRPRLVLLDEPTANLDPAGVLEVRDAVDRSVRASGATLVVVEHRVDVWLPVVDRIVVLEAGGGVVADGPPAEVLERRGAELAAQGVWVPAHPPVVPPREGTGGSVLLRAEDLAVARPLFGVRHPPVVASGLGLAVSQGVVTALTGANGAGKSTLALTLAGLLPAAGGSLAATDALARGAGRDPLRWRSRDLLPRIGMVFQEPEHQFVAGTVRDELLVGLRALRADAWNADAVVEGLLERLRLAGLAHAHPFTLSGGEKRRLSVATALATRPSVLVLDEPTFGQDSRTWAELAALLTASADEGTAVVMATHDRALIGAIADHEIALAGEAVPR